jgi:hypothetical protein
MVVHVYNPSTRDRRQEDPEFEASLGYIERLSQKTKKLRNKRDHWITS